MEIAGDLPSREEVRSLAMAKMSYFPSRDLARPSEDTDRRSQDGISMALCHRVMNGLITRWKKVPEFHRVTLCVS
ncbi:hypothetical protein [Bifidobacterium biavatii]|uniref:hypothetical protein n=1 Tax=Bifidobacterium biavatii TaxID=762212 RepID=UPI00126A1963|nr:hypothetical protein [Bifidobacterium biavatii]